MNFLAQEALKIPTPPTTSDPVTWIALLLVTALAGYVLWLSRACLAERKEMLAAFSAEMKAQREHDDVRTEKLHGRVDAITEGMTTILERIAHRPTESHR